MAVALVGLWNVDIHHDGLGDVLASFRCDLAIAGLPGLGGTVTRLLSAAITVRLCEDDAQLSANLSQGSGVRMQDG